MNVILMFFEEVKTLDFYFIQEDECYRDREVHSMPAISVISRKIRYHLFKLYESEEKRNLKFDVIREMIKLLKDW
jgi:hypothetical protein